MKQKWNSKQQQSAVDDGGRQGPSKRYRPTETLAELARMSAPEAVFPSKASEFPLPRYPRERTNAVNFAFANFLLGIRVNDEPRQNEAYGVLIRIARSAAQKVGGYILHSGDWEEIAINCIYQESRKHQELTAHEIVHCCEAKKFAYLWKALKCDFVDGIRKFQRREKTNERAAVVSGPESGLKYWDKRDYELAAEKYQYAAQHLRAGPAAIAEALAELCRNPKQLLDITAPELSDRASKTLFVQHVAKSRGVGAQVVRKDIRQFKVYCDDPEHVYLLDILRQNIIERAWRAPTITAPTAPALDPCALLAAAQTALADRDKGSKAWGAKCAICDTRLHNEGDFCSVCVPEDKERKFQSLCQGLEFDGAGLHPRRQVVSDTEGKTGTAVV